MGANTRESDMIKHTLLMVTVLTLLAAGAPAASPPNMGPAVSEVLVFDVGGNPQKFLQLSKRADAIAQKSGSLGKARSWISAYAGPNAGSVIVVVEYPSMVALAESTTKMRATPEWQQLVAEAQASSVKLVSDSIVVELKDGM